MAPPYYNSCLISTIKSTYNKYPGAARLRTALSLSPTQHPLPTMGNDPTLAEVQVEFAERPDDSPLRCAFEPLSEKDVTQRLSALARPERTVFDATRGRLADSVAFQPCLRYSSQDRFVVKQLEVQGQRWTFTGVFDGAFPFG